MDDYPENNFNKETNDVVYFFTPKFYGLDNFSAYQIIIWGNVFPTSEHAYQWRKFKDSAPLIAEEILHAISPHHVKKISDAHRDKIPASFQNEKLSIMEELLRAKVTQHERVQKALRETGTKKIIENAPMDSFWGAGAHGTGENMLGKLWMKLRSELE